MLLCLTTFLFWGTSLTGMGSHDGTINQHHRRVGIEGTIGQAANDKGTRRARYRGVERTDLQHLATAAAINLERVARWLMGERPEATRISPFAVLASPI